MDWVLIRDFALVRARRHLHATLAPQTHSARQIHPDLRENLARFALPPGLAGQNLLHPPAQLYRLYKTLLNVRNFIKIPYMNMR